MIGFSVKELGAIFGERDRGGAPNHRVRMMAAEKLVALEARLRELQSWRHELRRTLARWDRLLARPLAAGAPSRDSTSYVIVRFCRRLKAAAIWKANIIPNRMQRTALKGEMRFSIS